MKNEEFEDVEDLFVSTKKKQTMRDTRQTIVQAGQKEDEEWDEIENEKSMEQIKEEVKDKNKELEFEGGDDNTPREQPKPPALNINALFAAKLAGA